MHLSGVGLTRHFPLLLCPRWHRLETPFSSNAVVVYIDHVQISWTASHRNANQHYLKPWRHFTFLLSSKHNYGEAEKQVHFLFAEKPGRTILQIRIRWRIYISHDKQQSFPMDNLTELIFVNYFLNLKEKKKIRAKEFWFVFHKKKKGRGRGRKRYFVSSSFSLSPFPIKKSTEIYLCNFSHFTDVGLLIFKFCEGFFNPGNDLFMISADIRKSFREVETWNVYGQRGTAGGFIHRQSTRANHWVQGDWGWPSRFLLLLTLNLKIQWINTSFF